jgi:hypothetical protein
VKGDRVPLELQKIRKADYQRERIKKKRANGERVSNRKLVDPEQKKVNLVLRAQRQTEWSQTEAGRKHFKELGESKKKYSSAKEREKAWSAKKHQASRADFEFCMKTRLPSLRYRAKQKNFPFDLTVEDLILAYNKTCPYLGMELRIDAPPNSRNSLSIDRIDSSKGYVKGNIEIISTQANKMKDNATRDELVKFANRVLSVFGS